MFTDLKNKILALAKNAVEKAEVELQGEDGKVKKLTAVKYVVENLPIPVYLKPVIGVLLAAFIDSAIEIAVIYLNNRRDFQEIIEV